MVDLEKIKAVHLNHARPDSNSHQYRLAGKKNEGAAPILAARHPLLSGWVVTHKNQNLGLAKSLSEVRTLAQAAALGGAAIPIAQEALGLPCQCPVKGCRQIIEGRDPLCHGHKARLEPKLREDLMSAWRLWRDYGKSWEKEYRRLRGEAVKWLNRQGKT